MGRECVSGREIQRRRDERGKRDRQEMCVCGEKESGKIETEKAGSSASSTVHNFLAGEPVEWPG